VANDRVRVLDLAGAATRAVACAVARDIDVDVLSCSVCHSDVHLLDGDWGDVARPLVPGHEIVGRVVRAGERAGLALGGEFQQAWVAPLAAFFFWNMGSHVVGALQDVLRDDHTAQGSVGQPPRILSANRLALVQISC
jgi:NADPH:quinone reductase-like Zn-dependent oxidoreductase